jgi:AraC family transcriptional activator of pobA
VVIIASDYQQRNSIIQMKKKTAFDVQPVSLSDIHKYHALPSPVHPLISLIDGTSQKVIIPINDLSGTTIPNFYRIAFKPGIGGRVKYGQGYYDFNEGGMLFAAPNQLLANCGGQFEETCSMYTLLVHPDFFLSYPIAKKIKQYGFFSYSANEALHLSEKERITIISIFKNIEEELNSRIDDFSQDVIISQIELLLNYSNRFYKRQFITRKAVNNDLLQKLDDILDEYFNNSTSLSGGIPTVQYLSEQMNVSPRYLSDMVRAIIGQNTQSLIHQKIIEKAKEKLSTTVLSVSQVAYELGFEHPSSFTKLFRAKTSLSPLAFRKSFN